jgi:hypothetical protein
MLYEALWDAYHGTPVPNPVGHPMDAASNTVIVAPRVEQGATGVRMVLTCGTVTIGPEGQLPSVVFLPGGDISARVLSVTDVTYAVPGNSYPSQSQALVLVIDVSHNARLGLRNVQVANWGQNPGEAAPAFVNVVPAGSLGKNGP